MDDLRVNSQIVIDGQWLQESFVRASGPGGQNVNKVATAVELRFDASGCPALTRAMKERLRRLAGRRMTDQGVLVLKGEKYRTQERNRADVRQRLADLIIQSTFKPKPRVPTKPSYGAKQRRLDAKSRRGKVKAMRQSKPDYS